MAPRRYTSPVRAEGVERTKARLLEATHALLGAEGLDGLTLPRVATAAGVSIPTVYRHFPTTDDLLREFLAWIRPRIGQTAERLLGTRAADLPRLPAESYRRFDEHRAVLEPLMESRAWNRIRAGSMPDRARQGAAALREAAPRWTDADLEAAAGAIYLLASPQAWRWLRETWGLDSGRAARAASWAMAALVSALGAGAGLEPPPKPSRRKR